jgi:hypothetical protein
LELFLHIGSPKTGTSSIQIFLKSNHKLLHGKGILHPLTFGSKSHLVLPDLVKGLTPEGDMEDRPESRDELANEVGLRLRQELQDGDYNKIVFSSEFLWRLAEVQQLEFLRAFLERFFQKIFIVAYIRRQDEFVSSAWSTAVKGGATRPFSPEVLMQAVQRKVNYWKVLSLWAEVFGRENMIVRKYERPSLKNGDVVEDFLDAVRIDPGMGFKKSPPRNESLDANALEFLRLLNGHIGRNDRPRNLVPTLAEISKGPRLALSDEESARFQATFREANSKIAIQFFGGEIDGSDDPLFMPRTAAKEPVANHSLTVEQAGEIAAILLERKGGRRKAALTAQATTVERVVEITAFLLKRKAARTKKGRTTQDRSPRAKGVGGRRARNARKRGIEDIAAE